MLDVEFIGNDKKNEWLIRQFDFHRYQGLSLSDKVIPRPDIFIVFHFLDCPFFVDSSSRQLAPFFLVPIIPRSVLLQFHGKMDTMVVICKATVFSRIFDLDLSPVPRHSITLPHDIFFPVWSAMADLRTPMERVAYFTDFINMVQQTPYCPDAVDILCEKIKEKCITSPVKEIMQECYASKSTLLRKFIKRTGVSPKTLARIVRLDYLWKNIKDEGAINCRDLVFEGNYFDQSHFINDFKAVIGETPGYFFNRNLNVVKLFSGKPAGKQ